MNFMSFEDWVEAIFHHEEMNWWFEDEFWIPGMEQPPIAYLARLFENAGEVLAPYSDVQLKQGLWFVASNGASDYMFALLDTEIAWEARQRAVRGMIALYEQVFMPRCTPHLGHLDDGEQGASPLNMTCYMWWDILPISGRPANPDQRALDDEILFVMHQTLGLDSMACQESALHGLGHWHSAYPKRVEAMIDGFLANHADADTDLITYAKAARKGAVL